MSGVCDREFYDSVAEAQLCKDAPIYKAKVAALCTFMVVLVFAFTSQLIPSNVRVMVISVLLVITAAVTYVNSDSIPFLDPINQYHTDEILIKLKMDGLKITREEAKKIILRERAVARIMEEERRNRQRGWGWGAPTNSININL